MIRSEYGEDGSRVSNICRDLMWRDLPTVFKSSKLSLLCVNLRSMIGKFSELVAHLNIIKNKFTFIIITETWLSESIDFALDIDGYHSKALYRNNNGGGIKIYYLKNIKCSTIDSLTSSDGPNESLFLNCEIPGFGKLVVGGIYRPPDRNIRQFCNFMSTAFETIGTSKCIISGDININVLDHGNNNTQLYENVYSQFGYINVINKPTYFSSILKQDTTCLDHILHNMKLKTNNCILKPKLSDHYAVALISDARIDSHFKKIKFRNFCMQNKNRFLACMEDELGRFVESNDVDDYADNLFKFSISLLNRYFPFQTKVITEKTLKSPWVTTKIKKCIKKKHRWHRLYNDGIITYDSYKTIDKQLKN